MRFRCLFFKSVVLLAASHVSLADKGDPIPCSVASDCHALLQSSSACVDGFCTNPFRGGCLKQLKEGWNKTRACHSEDTEENLQHCTIPEFEDDYMEIRISALNWQSAYFNAWILQILLSELVGVPSTIETGNAAGNMDFYDATRPMELGDAHDWEGLRRAQEVGDCRVLESSGDDYQSCSPVVPETCSSVAAMRREMEGEGIIEKSVGIGSITEEGWFIPKFTLAHDPSLASYAGLMGPENRQKLANTFKRPTKWNDYCLLVSPDHCNTPDSVAQRPPTVEEESSYFVEGSYTGYFRATEKNNCDLNNSTFNCTGEFIDYPCGWTSYAYAMTHHLDIALEGSGDEPVIHGYSYREMGQIWAAANATRSHVMMQSWKPDTLYQSWVGTEAAWVRVDLPMPTLECLENRPPRELRCDPEADPTERFGSPLGTCDYHTSLLERMVVKKLHTETFDPSISPEKRSPGYDLIRSFTINELQMGQIMDYWTKMEDPREATCQWVVDNFDALVTTVPLTYPRTIEAMNDHLEGPLFYASLTLAILSVATVLTAAVVTHWKRDTRAIQFAQIEFLWIVLTGLLMVSIGSMIMVLPVRSDGICVATVWLVVLGSTFELIPLLVKVSALNRLMRAAKKMKRVKLERGWLFGAVFVIAFAVAMFLVVWTVVDPSKRSIAHELTMEEAEAGETIVAARCYCASESDGWRYTWVAVNMAMLICATVLAVQTRNVRDEVNESLTMSLMIYSHFLFMVLRVVLVAIESIADIWKLPLYQSILFSLDAMFSCILYFFPKFFVQPKSPTSRVSAGTFQPMASFGSSAGHNSALASQAQWSLDSSLHSAKTGRSARKRPSSGIMDLFDNQNTKEESAECRDEALSRAAESPVDVPAVEPVEPTTESTAAKPEEAFTENKTAKIHDSISRTQEDVTDSERSSSIFMKLHHQEKLRLSVEREA